MTRTRYTNVDTSVPTDVTFSTRIVNMWTISPAETTNFSVSNVYLLKFCEVNFTYRITIVTLRFTTSCMFFVSLCAL